jgi:putative ABC transport system permease protein
MTSIPAHVQVALRMLRKRPGLTLGRLLTVTLVVTAVSSVFTVANATFLRPLPFPDASRLVRVYLQPPNTSSVTDANPLHPLVFNRFRDRARSFARFEGLWLTERAVSGDAEPESVACGRVSAGFFAMLGGVPAIGRVFTEAEVEADARLVVLSHGLWMRRFGGRASAMGSTLIIDREPHTVVGVMASGFQPEFSPSELWTPLNLRRSENVAASFVRTIALLKPGVTAEQAASELDALLAAIRPEAPAMLRGWAAKTLDLRVATYGTRRAALYMLLAAVAALALIATANLANLTLADVMHRRADFAVRAALGGSRARIAGPEIAQSLLLAGAGGAAGLLGGAWLAPAVLSLDPLALFSRAQLAPDWRGALCALVVAAFVMIAAVAGPVIRVAGPGLASEVAGNRRASGGRSARRLRVALVASQTALALILLSSGALVVATFQRSSHLDPGFDPANVVTAQIRFPESAYATHEKRVQFIVEVLDRLRATPGVLGAATTLHPFGGGFSFVTLVHVEDRPTPDGEPHTVQFRRISPEYFQTLGIHVLKGRPFESRDAMGSQPVAIVSRRFAERFWPEGDPIGRRIRRGATSTEWSVIVGVVDDVRDVSMDQAPVETVYTPVLQGSSSSAPAALVVRTAGDPSGFVRVIEQAVWAVDRNQPLANVVTIEQFLASTLGPQRFRATLVAVCGLLGLLLATTGTYGVTARSVSERTKEVGIRLALGGSAARVWWTMAAGSLTAVIAGAVLGVAGSIAAASGLRALLPGLESGALWFSGAAATLLVCVGALAAVAAARSVTAVEPLFALRSE